MNTFSARVVGIDLAKKTFVAHILDPELPQARIIQGRTTPEGVVKFCKVLRATDRIGIECCALAFHLAKDIKSQTGANVLILNAGQLAMIYKSTKKTDLEDAAKIAWLLQKMTDEELPTVDLPSEQEEHRRALVSELRSKKKVRTSLVNRLHSLFVRQGITDIVKQDLKTAESRTTISAQLTGYTQSEAGRILEEIHMMESHIEAIEIEIKKELEEEPLAAFLVSIPGVGPSTAMAFLAYVGDGKRFTSGRQVSNFVGITPRIDCSGETNRIGSITKRGCGALRAVIVQAAWAAVHGKGPNRLKDKFEEISARRGKARAIVAVARRMLELMWVLVRKREYYWQTTQASLHCKLRYLGLLKLEKTMGVGA